MQTNLNNMPLASLHWIYLPISTTNGSPLFRSSFVLIISPPDNLSGLSKDSGCFEKKVSTILTLKYAIRQGENFKRKDIIYFTITDVFLLDIFEGFCFQLKHCLILDHQPPHCHSMKICCWSCHQRSNLKG